MTSPSNEFVPVLKYAVQTVGTSKRMGVGQIEDDLKVGRGQDEDDRPITFLGRGRALLEILGHGRGRAK